MLSPDANNTDAKNTINANNNLNNQINNQVNTAVYNTVATPNIMGGATPLPDNYNTGATPLPDNYNTGATPLPDNYKTGATPLPDNYKTGATALPDSYKTGATHLPDNFKYEVKDLPDNFQNQPQMVVNANLVSPGSIKQEVRLCYCLVCGLVLQYDIKKYYLHLKEYMFCISSIFNWKPVL